MKPFRNSNSKQYRNYPNAVVSCLAAAHRMRNKGHKAYAAELAADALKYWRTLRKPKKQAEQFRFNFFAEIPVAKPSHPF